MAQDPHTYLTASIIIGVFSLVALFGGIAIPLIEKGKLRDQITSDQTLTREETLAWGAVPGNRNISYQKAFTVYSLNTNNDQLLEGNVNAVSATTVLYNYTYEYTSLQFVPSANGSIQYFKAYNHTYMENDEDSLKSLYVNTVNIGAFRGVTQQADMSQAQVFIQALFKVYNSFQQDVVSLLYADNVFEFYIKNQTLTNLTIFMYQNTVTPELSQQLWSDPDYGWSKASGLLNWVLISQGYVGNSGFNPATVPQYTILKNHFNLTDNQMFLLTGAYPPGQAQQSSLLYLLINTVISTLSGQFTCASPMGCTAGELFSLQFFSAALTKNPIFEGIPSRASVADINQTYPAAPEIAAVNPNNVNFEQTLANALFGLNSNNNGPATNAPSLFGLKNVEFIIANQNNPGAVATYMALDDSQQAQVIIDYVNYLTSQFAFQDQTNLATKKYTADIAVANINNLAIEMGPLMSINITAMGTHNYTQTKGKSCADLLAVINASTTLISSICDNPDFTLDTAHGQASWVAAYYAGEGSSVYATIETVTGIADSDLQTLMNTSVSTLAQAIQTVVAAISTPLGCGQGPCDNGDLVSLQWATSGFTTTLPAEYYGNVSSYLSISDMMPGIFPVIPEFSSFYNAMYGVMPNLTVEQGKGLFTYNEGSINNNYEVLKLLALAQNNNYTGIQTRFGLNQNLTDSLFVYLDELFMYYYVGGLVQSISVYDLLWGYTDPFLSSLNNDNFFENVQLFNPSISLLGEKDSSDDSSDYVFSMINSGSDDEDNVRQVTSYNNNMTLALNQTYFDGNIYYAGFEPVWGGALQYINGTDGSGFAPLMEENKPITIFEGPFLRNLNYNYNSTITDSKSYEYYTYELDQSQFAKSDIYYNTAGGYMNLTGFDYTPLLVSLPYFTACDANSFTGVTIDGKLPATLQADAPTSSFVVESLSGVTANFTKNYQYNIYNLMPFFLTKQNNAVAIPLFQVSEIYTTPSWNYENDLQSYYGKQQQIKVAMIVVLVFAFILFVTAGVLAKLYYSANKKLAASRLNVNPGDFASLGVDSDGARSSLQPLAHHSQE